MPEVARSFVTVAARTNQMESDVVAAAQRSANAAERALSGLKVSGVAESASREFSKVSRSAEDASQSAASSLALLGKRATTMFAGFAAGGAIIKGVMQAASFEQLQIAFTGLLGNAERANAFLARLQKFAAETPFEFQGLARATQQLIGLGQSADQAVKTLQTIGNAAAAVGASQDSINRVVLAISQIQAKGRLSAEELNQIAEALPNLGRTKVFEALADQMGLTTAAVSKLAETGGISAEQGIKALTTAMENVPGAAGAMERQSKSLSGIISTLKDNLANAATRGFTPLAKSISETLLPRLDDLGKQLEKTLIPLGASLSGAFGAAVDVFTALAPVIPPLADALSSLLAGFVNIGQALTPLMAGLLGPLVPMLQAIAGAFEWITSVIPVGLLQALAVAFAALKVERLATFVLAFAQSLVVAATAAGGAAGAMDALAASILGVQASLGVVGLAFGVLIGIYANYKILTGDNTKETNKFTEALKLQGDAAKRATAEIIVNQLSQNDLGKTLKEAGISVEDFTTGVTGGAEKSQALRDRLLGLNESGKISAIQFAFLASTVTNLESEYGRAATSGEVLQAVQKALGITTEEVGGAANGAAVAYDSLLKSLTAAVAAQDALDAANNRIKDSQDAVTSAQRAYDKLREKGAVDAKKVAQAERGVADAHRSVEDAIYARTKAQKALEELLKPATARELGDAQDEVAQAQLNLTRATQRRADAEALLAKLEGRAARAGTLSKKRQEELTNARLDATQARLDEKNASEALDDANKGLTDTEQKGKVVTDEVAEAKKAAEDANDAVTEALTREKEAHDALTEAQKGDINFSDQLAAAKTTLDRATRSHNEAIKDAKVKQDELNTALDTGIGKTQTAEEKLHDYTKRMLELGGIQGPLREELQKTFDKIMTVPEIRERFDLHTTQQIIDFLLAHPEFADRTFDLLGLSEGGIFSTPTPAMVGHGKEVVIPLEKPRRAAELVRESGLMDVIGAGTTGPTKIVNIDWKVTVPSGLDAVAVTNLVTSRVLAAIR